ncbi:MAG: PIG-L deacetylase family protein [Rhodothermales bacterium]
MASLAAASTASSLLAHPERLPLHAPDAVQTFGATLVVAPHPDDESLGCGGALALLARYGMDVRVLFMSDGTGSHPNSRTYPAPRLAALREAEAHAALAALGLGPSVARFLRLQDTRVPFQTDADFESAVLRCRAEVAAFGPATILLPWRRDPHGDHQASWQIVRAAVASLSLAPRLIEYPVWIWEHLASDDTPQRTHMTAWRLDVRDVLPEKCAAIEAHRSQVSDLISDDPDGFRLKPSMISHFLEPWEVYLESV